MKKIKKILIPTIIIAASAAIVMYVRSNPPQAERRPANEGTQILVQVSQITPRPYQIVLNSFGVVSPRTESSLVAQVSGQIIKVSEQFRDGGFFEKGEALAWIDERDFIAEAKITQANVLSAQQALQEEQARSEQALIDWKRLGNGSQASDLVLRKPQLEAAKASVLSAQAQSQKAELALERTVIRAPVAGRILQTQADLGQVVSNNATVASIYAIDVVEVRLPISNSDLSLIDLPKEYRGNTTIRPESKVFLSSDLVGEQTWLAQIVRSEGAIDSGTQQLYVVAQIEDPYSQLDNNIAPIKIGQYVNAELMGKELKEAIVIPNSTIYQGSYVYVLINNTLMRREISIKWQNNEEAVIEEGLQAGETLVLTPMGQVSSGTKVQIQDEQPSNTNINIMASGDASKQQRQKQRPSREELEKIAKEKGISVEKLMAEQRKRREQP